MPLQIAGRQIKQMGANVGDVLAWNGSDYAPASPASAPIPTGLIVMWSGLLVNIPAGWALCDGTAGTPDLRDKFVRGAAAGADPGATGGAATHTHAGHSNHVVTQPSNHVVTQPGAHSNHVVTQPSNHVVTQPDGHSNHAVTQPSDHASHTHDIASTLATPDLFDDLLSATGVSGRTGGPSATLTHAGTAVDAHSAHAGAAVDAHSGAAVDAHSAHSGAAVDAHSGTAVDAHSAHDSVSLLPVFFALAYIMKT